MDKKVEVEISLKDNMSKQLNALSQSVKNVAKDMQNAVKSIQNSFNNITLNMNTKGIDNSINGIKNKLKGLSNEKVEINGKVNIDDTNLKKVGNNSSILGTGAMMVASSQVSDAVQQMSANIRQAFSASVKDTDIYQQKIKDIGTAFQRLQNLAKPSSGILGQGGFNREELKSLQRDVIDLMNYFKEFENSVEGASDALTALNSIQDIAYNKDLGKKGGFDFDANKIKNEIQTAIKNSIPNEGVKIPVQIKNLAEEANKVVKTVSAIKRNEIEIKTNDRNLKMTEYRLKELKTKAKASIIIGDEAGANKYVGAMNRLLQSMKQLSSEGRVFKDYQAQLNTELSKNQASFDRAKQKVKEFSQAQNDAVGSTSKFKGALSGLMGTLKKLLPFLGIYQLIRFGKQCVETTSDLQEVANVIEVTFGDATDEVNRWAKENASAFGLSELSAKRYIGTMGSILQSSGMGEYTVEMSKNLTQLSGKMLPFLIEILVIIIAKLNWKPKWYNYHMVIRTEV